MKRDLVATAGALLKGRAGLTAERTVRARLARCLDEGAARLGLSEDAYLARLETDEVAFQELLDRVTVQHSSFFRDPNQFAALKEIIAGAPSPIMIWSAASGNGQEPYSVAMLLEESGRDDWRILATDVSLSALGRVRAGRYGEAEVAGVSNARLHRHFTRSGHEWEIVRSLRERVDVRRHNLCDARLPVAAASFWLIFCRNVLIYFDAPEVSACVGRLAACLPAGGHLFLGFSESLPPASSELELVRIGDAFVYRKGPVTAPQQRRSSEPKALLAEGERAFAAGDPAGAVAAFRKATCLDPDQPVAYFQLGTALECVGDRREARLAFAAAGAALARADPSARFAGLEGYSARELERAIAVKLGAS